MSESVFGRPPKYTKVTFREKIEEYLEYRNNYFDKGLVTVLDFCVFAGVDKGYISEHDLGSGDLA